MSVEVFSKILKIDLMHLKEPTLTVTVFEEDANKIEAHRCLQASNHMELAYAVRQFWESRTSQSCEPKVLCITHYTAIDDHMPQHQALFLFGTLGALIEMQFKAQFVLRTRKKLIRDYLGTRVFQKLAHPPFHEPERNFFPAKAGLSSSK